MINGETVTGYAAANMIQIALAVVVGLVPILLSVKSICMIKMAMKL